LIRTVFLLMPSAPFSSAPTLSPRESTNPIRTQGGGGMTVCSIYYRLNHHITARHLFPSPRALSNQISVSVLVLPPSAVFLLLDPGGSIS
jgi:hypothetical protein